MRPGDFAQQQTREHCQWETRLVLAAMLLMASATMALMRFLARQPQ
jgi:hypothetical protein